jgi:nucleoside-diphosphate-sugar epimerase
VLDAFTRRDLIIYQRGYSRSFIHIRDAVRGMILGLEAERAKVCSEVFNLGTDEGNYSKDDIVRLILKRMPETVVEYRDLTFGGDVRDIAVSFAKIKQVLGFETTLDADDGIRELLFALKTGIIRNPTDEKYRNARFIVQ